MPWDSIDDLPESIKDTLPSDAQQLFLKTFNSAWNGPCKDHANQEACAMQSAWGAVKKIYKKQGDKWILITKAEFQTIPTKFTLASAENPHIITGPIIEIGKINLNKWGIPNDEIEINSIKAGLIGRPLKICSGKDAIFDQHSCDYKWDPAAAIGQIISTHIAAGWIHATAEVTDLVAQQKIKSGTWTDKWSIFGGYQFEDKNHMRYGTIPRSITLVDDPAYPGAGYKQATQAAQEAQPLPATSQSSLINSNEKENDSMAEENDPNDPKTYTQEELDKQLAEAVAADHATMTQQQEDLTTVHEDAFAASKKEHADALETKDKEISDLQAAAKKDPGSGQDDMIPKTEVETMITASKEGMVPREEVEKMISAATDAAATSTKDMLAREQLSAEIATLKASFGIIEEKDLEATKAKLIEKSAAALEDDLALLKKMSIALETHSAAAVDKFKELNLPSSGKSGGSDMGTWDPIKKEWI